MWRCLLSSHLSKPRDKGDIVLAVKKGDVRRLDAQRKAAALVAQLTRRKDAMKLEIAWSRNSARKMPPGFTSPPLWVIRAATCAASSWHRLLEQHGPATGETTAGHLGVFVGAGSMFAAHLNCPDGENAELEKTFPELAQYRAELSALLQPDFELSSKIETAIPSAAIPPTVLNQYRAGQASGAELVSLEQPFQTIRSEVCYFLWLYWEQVHSLKSLSALMDFLTEFEVGGLTQKNLEKICRQIGLRLKNRGRPKNLLRSKSK